MITNEGPVSRENRPENAHVVRFYDDDAVLMDEVAGFIAQALQVGGVGLVIATPAHEAELRRQLGKDAGHSAQHLVFLDAQVTLECFMVDGWPDEQAFRRVIRQAAAPAIARGAVLHAFGEMVALLCAEGRYGAAIRLEQMWNALSDEMQFSLFCAYPWQLFPNTELAEQFEQVCAQHSHACTHAPAGRIHDVKGKPLRLVGLERKALTVDAEVARRKDLEQALRQREQELADFVENAAEGLHRVGPDGTILWANKAELQMLGYRWEEYVGHPIADFHVDAPVIEQILETLGAGGTLYDQPARLRCKDGSVKHVLINSNGLFEHGKLRYTRCFTRDATAHHERDEALAQRERMLDELTAANRTKDEFLAMLGHELRNPLSPIVTALQLMRLRGTPGAERERAIIERQVDHLVRLVDDLMDVARATRGQIELKFEHVDIAQPLAKAVEMASLLLEQRGHRMEVDIEPGLRWEGDPMRLAQVVSNLLTNAARYTPHGGRIALRGRSDGPGWLCISVTDNGIGLAEDMLTQVFDLFFQGKRGVDRSEGGLGIGLALVKNIVELHGGVVQARSAGAGQGSEFVVRLPLRSAGASSEPAAALGVAPAFAQRRIMIVDDNVDAAETLGLLLEAHGHVVEVFNDPAAALDAVQRLQPDLAVLDIGLPDMDGCELAVRLRRLLGAHPCRLVALSGYGQEADRERSAAAGFARHLVKPITPDEVARLAGDA
ncbi:ATP-binding protein [Massilia niabensis]|uniref:histidine kinase n=1 Tax=Massilia niabensis TaxID=544910 RepID=A0ABW0L220_9BURK